MDAHLSRSSRRVLSLLSSTILAIGLVLWKDSSATATEQLGLGVAVSLLLLWHLRASDTEERTIVLACVAVSVGAELFCTQVWGLYRYRFGNVPLYVPPGHGLLCLCSLAFARLSWTQRHRRTILAVTTLVALAWAGGGLFLSARPDVEGALYLPIFLPLLLLTSRGLEHSCTFALASLVEIAGTWFSTWAWNPIQPWLGVPAANPPSVAAGGYCTFTLGALGLAWLLTQAQEAYQRRTREAALGG